MEGMKTTMKDNAVGVFGFAQRQVDRVVSPNMRQTAYENTSNFAAAKPLLFVRPSPMYPGIATLGIR